MRKIAIILSITAFLLILQIRTQTISCPILTCDSILDLDVCFEHDEQQPVEVIRAYGCEGYIENTTIAGTPICDFNLQKGNMAWYYEASQALEKSSDPTQSPLYQKKMSSSCRDVSSLYQMLNNGRSCSNSSQCYSKKCENGVCKGRDRNEYCHRHADCDNGYYCKKDSNWPYKSYCEKSNTNYEQCTEDYECGPSAYCWFVSSDDRALMTKKCLPLYSQEKGTSMGWYSKYNRTNITYEDFEINGRYCKSGLAFPVSNISGNCTATDHIKFKGTTLSSPYKCDPTTQSFKCELWYNASEPNDAISLPQQSFNVTCGCALDGNNGFCSKVLGSPEYIDYAEKIKKVIEASNCHTLDRADLRAQRDVCGIGGGDELDNAVSAQFNMRYWPMVNANDQGNCIKSFFGDSLFNQQKTNNAVGLYMHQIFGIILIVIIMIQ